MFEKFNETELLELIEGGLEPRAAAKLRAKLARDPKALAAIERMAGDRAALRSTGEPELPFDFVSRLEPQLARPMLMEPVADVAASTRTLRPGEFRRKHRRATHRIRWGRIAAAAALVIVASGGIWAAINGLDFASTHNQPNLIALGDQNTELITGSSERASQPMTGIVHHDAPSLDELNRALTAHAVPVSHDDAAVVHPDYPRRVVLAQFAITLEATGMDAAEHVVMRSIETVDSPMAIVRNFNFEEAAELEHQWRIAQGLSGNDRRSGDSSPPLASFSSADFSRLADCVRQHINGGGRVGSETGSELVAQETGRSLGDAPADLAAPLECQLDFSSRGATHTVSVPAAKLKSFLAALNADDSAHAILRRLPDNQQQNEVESPSQAVLLWLADGAKVRAEIEALAESPSGTMIFVPITVKAPQSK